MTSDVRIRSATSDDGEQIVAVDRATTSHTVSPGDGPTDATDAFARVEPADVLVADAAGTVVGYLALGHPTPLASNAHVWQVQALAVEPGHGRRGIGRALLRAAVEEATRRGGTRLTLRVLATNPPARALYEAEGFVVEGVLHGEFVLDGAPVDDVLMARPLP